MTSLPPSTDLPDMLGDDFGQAYHGEEGETGDERPSFWETSQIGYIFVTLQLCQ